MGKQLPPIPLALPDWTNYTFHTMTGLVFRVSLLRAVQRDSKCRDESGAAGARAGTGARSKRPEAPDGQQRFAICFHQ